MSLSVTEKLTKLERSQQLDKIAGWARGGPALDTVAEQQDDLTFEDVIADANTALEALAGEAADDAKLRTYAVYAAALARDLQYSAAGRKRLFDLGVHNALRETYEGGKIAIDSNNTA